MKKEYSTLDVYLTSWIYLHTGIYPELDFYDIKVIFRFPLNEEVFSAINDFNSNAEVSAILFTQTIKHFKSQIFQHKDR